MYVIAQKNSTSNMTANETTLINQNVSKSKNVSNSATLTKAAARAARWKLKREALLQAAARAQKKSQEEQGMMTHKNVTANATKNYTVNASEAKEPSQNESSLISIANSEQKQTARHNGKELLQANKDIIITVAENVSQGSDKKASIVQYPKPIVPEVK